MPEALCPALSLLPAVLATLSFSQPLQAPDLLIGVSVQVTAVSLTINPDSEGQWSTQPHLAKSQTLASLCQITAHQAKSM